MMYTKYSKNYYIVCYIQHQLQSLVKLRAWIEIINVNISNKCTYDSKCKKIKIEFGIDSNDLHKVFQNQNTMHLDLMGS